MISTPKQFRRVADLLDEQQLQIEDLVESSGVERRVVEAIVHHRYTPSPDQRNRVSHALGVDRNCIIWGHLCAVEPHIHSPD